LSLPAQSFLVLGPVSTDEPIFLPSKTICVCVCLHVCIRPANNSWMYIPINMKLHMYTGWKK
jgi:hypothetical protein